MSGGGASSGAIGALYIGIGARIWREAAVKARWPAAAAKQAARAAAAAARRASLLLLLPPDTPAAAECEPSSGWATADAGIVGGAGGEGFEDGKA